MIILFIAIILVMAFVLYAIIIATNKNKTFNERMLKDKEHKDWILSKVYADEGISGTSLRKRDDFNRMYRDGLNRKFDIILTKEVCRFARNTVDTLEKTREFKRAGIEVRFIIDNISTFDTDGELRLTIMAGMAQDESRRISERVQFGVIQSMKKGIAFGNNIYGYEFRNGQLYVVEKEARIVKLIFHKYLNEGEVDFIFIKDHHEAIIDRETFEATRKELERRSRMHKMEKSKYSSRQTLSGKLICGECGHNYVGGVSRQRADKSVRRSWRCSTAANYGKKHIVDNQEIGCNNERVNDEVLKASFNEIMKNIINNKAEIQNDIENTISKVIDKCRVETSNIDFLIKQKEKLEKEKDKLLDLCLNEIITDIEYKNKSTSINNKLQEIYLEIKNEEDKRKVRENLDEIIKGVRERVSYILSMKKINKNICKEVVDKIVVYNKKKFDFYIKGNEDPFNINYKGDILYCQHW